MSRDFGSLLFTSAELKKELQSDLREKFERVERKEQQMTRELSDAVAGVMLKWALQHGATHYTHWFQPLTGGTAEKHDSFLDRDGAGFTLKFQGTHLIKGEADASSLPSGSSRSTFEARGYTIWDSSSPAFLRVEGSMKVLYIPTAFCAYNGSALDEKTPLLRAMDQLHTQTIRVLRHLGNTTAKNVTIYAGPEQEYFLIDQKHFAARPDLQQTGRTLFGAQPPKTQQLQDQYYAAIKPRVLAFMAELNTELYKLGVPAKTQHNEVAPSQHELATIYAPVQIAMDQNQLVMETMKKVASRHGLHCLLHEKPFAGLNGSGKHNNWSFGTETENLLDPNGPQRQFMLCFMAVIAAVDRYADLLRLSTAHPANSHRLGGHEAPPAIISVFIGDDMQKLLDDLLDQSRNHQPSPSHPQCCSSVSLGAQAIPRIHQDSTDRNRTSPFAFTGNKFEFRMVGSSQSIGMPNTVLCASVAQIFREIADKLDRVQGGALAKESAIDAIIVDLIEKHRRVIFNGNNYSNEWVEEARRRGLPMLQNAIDAYKCATDEKNVKLFEQNNIMTEEEILTRQSVNLKAFINQVLIEAECMTMMSRRYIEPSARQQLTKLCESLNQLRQTGLSVNTIAQQAGEFNTQFSQLDEVTGKLEQQIQIVKSNFDEEQLEPRARAIAKSVQPLMVELRAAADWMECHVDRKLWQFPTYSDILFYE